MHRTLPPPGLRPSVRRRTLAALLGAALVTAAGVQAQPRLLSDTGLFVAGSTTQVQAQNLPFAPAYPLWSDGTGKRRWMFVPAGQRIDASRVDAWQFPRGTKFWKEFAFDGRIETRLSERLADGRWRFATYVWRADGSDAELAPAAGASLPRADAPGGVYALPSRDDCNACHADAPTPVLGFGALQLAGELPALAARGLFSGLPDAMWREPPRIAAANAVERDARGYLHGNCGHCHHATGVPVPLVLAQSVAGTPAPEPQQLAAALQRMGTRDPYRQMPPLGSRIVDAHGMARVQAWLDARQTRDPPFRPEPQPQPASASASASAIQGALK